MGVSQVNPASAAAVDTSIKNGDTTEEKKPSCKTARNLAIALGAGGLATAVALSPKAQALAVAGFTKAVSAMQPAAAFVSANLASFAVGGITAGLLNIADGVRSSVTNVNKLKALSKKGDITADNKDAFSKLKRLYASSRNRGILQTAIGVAAVSVGVLTLAGVLSNPFGLAAAGGVATIVLLGAQLHKFLKNRQIRALERQVNFDPNTKTVEKAAPAVKSAVAEGLTKRAFATSSTQTGQDSELEDSSDYTVSADSSRRMNSSDLGATITEGDASALGWMHERLANPAQPTSSSNSAELQLLGRSSFEAVRSESSSTGNHPEIKSVHSSVDGWSISLNGQHSPRAQPT